MGGQVPAQVAGVPHFSAHADATQSIDWLRGAPPRTPPTWCTASPTRCGQPRTCSAARR
ncbi:MBL fold metallo-hydrolase RNA specificity domain-containing protein [Streptomyces sp. MMG1533]|uniref:MBL fold metallo-hydrolase RNA specificity domain-containing protein n=1 Tax=Streptomyces sp. MMG1533 TaxID=1415546 RepID=UPI000B05F2FA|nr:MBL fold metallo-hydrolase RNA specificity domain-containing protein [Streptomyces sp. MMG1533]